jgi:hypothetical protein
VPPAPLPPPVAPAPAPVLTGTLPAWATPDVLAAAGVSAQQVIDADAAAAYTAAGMTALLAGEGAAGIAAAAAAAGAPPDVVDALASLPIPALTGLEIGTPVTGDQGTDIPLYALEDLPSVDELGNPIQLLAYTILTGDAFVTALVGYCDTYNVDPLAAVGAAHGQGLGGGIGDGGTSFGPWQLHAGGALPARYAALPLYSPTAQSWAWSAGGMKYALHDMAINGAAGLRGHAACERIVNHFEWFTPHPAAVADAEAVYDQLAALGTGWKHQVAAWAQGPSLNPVSNPLPGSTPTVTPAGVQTNWRQLVDVFKTQVPKGRASIKSNADALANILKVRP